MLNYICLALITIGIGTALTSDICDIYYNKYNNGKPLDVIIKFENNSNIKDKSHNSILIIKSHILNDFYKLNYHLDFQQKAKLTRLNDNSYYIYFSIDNNSPSIFREVARSSGNEDDINGKLFIKDKIDSINYRAELFLEKVTFTKMRLITNAVIEYAGNAVKIAIGLIGVMSLWLGIMKIAEDSGIINIIAKILRPLTKFLFPEIPQNHPAISAIIMNISANMLGLGNAATPFGLKAMEELDKLNTKRGIATNAMCTFLAINTAGLTLIPATAIAIRAAAGSSNPTIIIGTSFFGALCATLTGIFAAKTLEKFPFKFANINTFIKINYKKLLITFLIISFFIFLFLWLIKYINLELVKDIIQIISIIAIPAIIIAFILFGIIKKIKVYEVFIEGAKDGFNIAVRIIPYLVAMLMAIGVFRAGGAMDVLVMILTPFTSLIGFPAEAVPMALMRPLSGSGALGIMSEIISVHGPDSFIGILVSTIMGSTETTFYVLALYFGSVNISKTRHAVTAGILADLAGILGAFFIVKLLFG